MQQEMWIFQHQPYRIFNSGRRSKLISLQQSVSAAQEPPEVWLLAFEKPILVKILGLFDNKMCSV